MATRTLTWLRGIRSALARDAPARNPKPQHCTVDTSCEEGHHTYSWPCDYAPGTGRLAFVGAHLNR